MQKIGSVSADVGFSKQGEKPKSLKALKDLPKTWWREASSDRGGYQRITDLTVMDRVVKTLLDTGAAINAVTEEFLVALLNCAAKKGVVADRPDLSGSPDGAVAGSRRGFGRREGEARAAARGGCVAGRPRARADE